MSTSDGGSSELYVGARVRVLPGRQFPAFASGDSGEVRRIDAEARTCDVLFDGRSAGTVAVAIRHLCMESFDDGMVTPIAATMAAEELMRRGRASPPRSLTPQTSTFRRYEAASAETSAVDASQNRRLSPGLSPRVPFSQESSARDRAFEFQEKHLRTGSRTPPHETFCRTTSRARLQEPGLYMRGLDSAALSPPVEIRSQEADLAARIAALESHASGHGEMLAAFDSRLASCELATNALQLGQGTNELSPNAVKSEPARRLVAARVAALEGAHQAEVNDLRRALDDAMSIAREHEQQQKKQRAAAKDAEDAALVGEKRVQALRELARSVEISVQSLAERMEAQERRAVNLNEVVGSAEDGITRLGALLESKEHRTAELGQAIRASDDGVASIKRSLEDHTARFEDLGTRVDAFRIPGAPVQKADAPRSIDTEPIWQALRELQELVVNESEHRAAGLREVLGVVGQSVEQLRNEQARHASDCEDRVRSDGRRVNKRIVDVQSKGAEYEKRADVLDQRLDALNQALAAERCARAEVVAWIQEQLRDAPKIQPSSVAVQKVQSPGATSAKELRSLTIAPGAVSGELSAAAITSTSLQRLEALEARFDRAGASIGATATQDGRVAAAGRGVAMPREEVSAPLSTVGMLQGQPQNLRYEMNSVGSTATSPSVPARFVPGVPGAATDAVYYAPSQTGQNMVAPTDLHNPGVSYVTMNDFYAPGETNGAVCMGTSSVNGANAPAKVVRCYSAPNVRAPRASAPAEPASPRSRLPPSAPSVRPAPSAAAQPGQYSSSTAQLQPQSRVGAAHLQSSAAAVAQVRAQPVDVFAALDRNHDGVLSRDEFAALTALPRIHDSVTREAGLTPSVGNSPAPLARPALRVEAPMIEAAGGALGPRMCGWSTGACARPSCAATGPNLATEPTASVSATTVVAGAPM